MTLEEKSKFLIRYGDILSDIEFGELRLRIIMYGNIKFRHIMKAGKCIDITSMSL